MKLSTCPNGHFFDSDKYASCPYCAPRESEDKVTEALYPEASAASAPVGSQREASAPVSAPQPLRAVSSGAAAAQPVSQPTPAPQPASQPTPAAQPVSPAASAPQPASVPVSPQRSASAPASAINTAADGWAEEDENCTVGYYSQVLGIEPVVGWMVCIKGAYRGESFKLKSGRNFIGRASNMDIVLTADQSVSRLRHAAVVYDPKSRSFIVAAGDARELCYLNGELVITSHIMKEYDVLSCGNTDLMLIPLCGERFSWEDGIEQPQEEA